MYDYTQSPIRSLDGLIGNKLATINSASQQLWTYTLSNNLVHIQFHQNFFDGPAQGGNIIKCSYQFLDFMWCLCLYWFISEEESKKILAQNQNAQFLEFSDADLCNYYNRVFEHMDSIYLGNDSNIWDSNMFSPTHLSNSPIINDYINKANSLYSTAICFILSHELGHFFYQHQFIKNNHNHNIQNEEQADDFAINLIFNGNPNNLVRFNLIFGTLLGCLSCLHLYGHPSYPQTALLDHDHPPLHNRLAKILKLNSSFNYGPIINGININEDYFYHLITQVIGFYLERYCQQQLPSYVANYDNKAHFLSLLPFINQYIHA